jgi:Fe-S cluster assembly protein SufD
MSETRAPTAGVPPGETFLARLLSGTGGAAAGEGWVARLRAAALERANALSVPTTREEDWRFTDLAPLTRLAVQPAAAPAAPGPDAIAPWILAEAAARLVFVDGIYAHGLSSIPAGGPGVAVTAWHGGAGEAPDGLDAILGTVAGFDSNLFAALNTAFLRDAAIIQLAPDAVAQSPVHVLHVSTARGEPHATYPRTLLVAGRGSRCTLLEDYVAIGDGAYLSSPVTEIVVGEEAVVEHVRVQREAGQAFQLATCAVRQARSSEYRASALAFGARISRYELTVTHAGPGAQTHLDGLALIGDRQLADTHTFVDHAHPQGQLRQLHKCVVGGGAHAVFNGRIVVREGAQQVDARQASRNLLLSDRAHIDTKPQLEIFADDVKCAHGAAVGQLDQDELFYLRSRGLDDAAARRLLTYAFAAEIIERLHVRSLGKQLATYLSERTA